MLAEKIPDNTTVGLSFGIESRKPLSDHLDFVYGIDLADAFLYEPGIYVNVFGINGVIGANYRLIKNVLIGAEVTPFVGLSAYKSTNSGVWERDFYYNISNSGVELFIAVQF